MLVLSQDLYHHRQHQFEFTGLVIGLIIIGLKHDIIARIEPVTVNISIYNDSGGVTGGDHFVVNLSFTLSDI